MPPLTANQRIAYVRAIWETFKKTWKVTRFDMTSGEYELARSWAVRGLPLGVVLQGMSQTGGKPRTLHACENAVAEEVERWSTSLGGLTRLPEPGPLENP